MDIKATPFRFRASDNIFTVARIIATVEPSIASAAGSTRPGVDAGVTTTPSMKLAS